MFITSTLSSLKHVKTKESIATNLSGFLFGDKGYLSAKTTTELLKHGHHLIIKVRQNMTNDAGQRPSNLQLAQLKNKKIVSKPKPISESNKFLLKKRGIIETIFGQPKDFRHLVHAKYRSKINYFTNILSSLLAYMLNPNKPAICLNRVEMA